MEFVCWSNLNTSKFTKKFILAKLKRNPDANSGWSLITQGRNVFCRKTDGPEIGKPDFDFGDFNFPVVLLCRLFLTAKQWEAHDIEAFRLLKELVWSHMTACNYSQYSRSPFQMLAPVCEDDAKLISHFLEGVWYFLKLFSSRSIWVFQHTDIVVVTYTLITNAILTEPACYLYKMNPGPWYHPCLRVRCLDLQPFVSVK